MRKITLSLLAWLVYTAAFCGTPQGISYQAVALSASGNPIKSRTIGLRLSILSGGPSGTLQYQERQTPTTDVSGVFSVVVGNGSLLSGSFVNINWSSGIYFLKTELDTTGGTSYNTVGTTQFFSVPYALYSGSAASANLSSPDFPDGMLNITPIQLDGVFSYTVPTGSTLYITQITGNDSVSSCPMYGVSVEGVFMSTRPEAGLGITSGSSAPPNMYLMSNPIIVPQGVSVSSASCATSLVGFIAPRNYSWVLFDLSIGNYTVPPGQVLVIKNMISGSNSGWNNRYKIGSNSTTFGPNPSFADQGQTISATGLSNSLLMMGYLKPR